MKINNKPLDEVVTEELRERTTGDLEDKPWITRGYKKHPTALKVD